MMPTNAPTLAATTPINGWCKKSSKSNTPQTRVLPAHRTVLKTAFNMQALWSGAEKPQHPQQGLPEWTGASGHAHCRHAPHAMSAPCAVRGCGRCGSMPLLGQVSSHCTKRQTVACKAHAWPGGNLRRFADRPCGMGADLRKRLGLCLGGAGGAEGKQRGSRRSERGHQTRANSISRWRLRHTHCSLKSL